jgi:hypothetical protein
MLIESLVLLILYWALAQTAKPSALHKPTALPQCASNDAAVPEQGGEIGIVWGPSNRQGRMPGHFTRQCD